MSEDKVYPVPVAGSPTRGPADAPITIVAFSDFQCPFCAKGAPEIEDAIADFDPDEVRLVFKHYPLPMHNLATAAARAWVELRPEDLAMQGMDGTLLAERIAASWRPATRRRSAAGA